MKAIDRVVERVNTFQQGFRPAGFAFGVVKKYGDDRGGNQAALIAYYGFLSLFPLMLLLITILGLIAGSHPSFAAKVEDSALAQFPVIGNDLESNLHGLHHSSAFGLIVGIVGLLWGSQGAIQAGQLVMAEVWNVPQALRPKFTARLIRTGVMIIVLGVFLVATTIAASLSGLAATAGGEFLSVVTTAVLNIVLFVLAFRILTPPSVAHRDLVLGGAAGGIAWTVIQLAGTLLVQHQLRGSSEIYGFFAIVLGLMAWIYLGAMITVYSAELNVVKAKRLWPRSMVPPLTTADERARTERARRYELPAPPENRSTSPSPSNGAVLETVQLEDPSTV